MSTTRLPGIWLIFLGFTALLFAGSVVAQVEPDKSGVGRAEFRLDALTIDNQYRLPVELPDQAAANARKHADMLEAQGVAAEIHAPKDEELRYWIDYERPADADAPERAGERSRPAPQIVPRDCGRVAGP